ncbi:MAG: LTA synthase family protein [Salibacteraceae bacterium]
MKLRLPHPLKDLLKVFLILILFQTVLRLGFFYVFLGDAKNAIPSEIFLAFIDRGLLYDSYISSMAMTLPSVVVLALWSINPKIKYGGFLKTYLAFILSVILLIAVVDLAYFDYYHTRLSKMVLVWFDWGDQLVAEWTSNSFYLVLTGVYLVMIAALIWGLKTKINFSKTRPEKGWPIWAKIPASLLFLFVVLCGMRGTPDFNKHPLTFEDSFVFQSPFLNQVGLNAPFTFFSSFQDTKMDFISSDKEAFQMVKNELSINNSAPYSIERNEVNEHGFSKPANVVMILVESMSEACFKEEPIMPFVDSLRKESVNYTNMYSAGVHTYNGIFSTLFSIPAVMDRRTMSSSKSAALKFSGLSHWLKKEGYHNSFLVTGDKNFDNMNSFLNNNGFDEVIGESDYESVEGLTSWGYSDKYLYEMCIKTVNKNNKFPFFSTLLTINSHKTGKGLGNISEEDYYKPEKGRYKSADDCMRKFFEDVSKEKWFENTLFIILGDHGQNFYPVYSMPLSYNQIPLLFYYPGKLAPETKTQFAHQIDVGPTTMGLLGFDFRNTTLGIDLNKQKRRYAYFSADDKIGVLDSTHFLILNKSHETLYNYKEQSTKNLADLNKDKVEDMKQHAFSMIQVADFITSNRIAEMPK